MQVNMILREPCLPIPLAKYTPLTGKSCYLFQRQAGVMLPCVDSCNFFDAIMIGFCSTYRGRSQGSRHTYIEKCIGTREKAGTDKRFSTLAGAAKSLRVPKITLLKIDIEGYEFDEMAAWRAEDLTLPEQISIEMHHSQVMYAGGSSYNKPMDFSNLLWPIQNMSQSDLSLFFSHLSRLGYGIASREDNPIGNCCSEFLLLKIADWRLID